MLATPTGKQRRHVTISIARANRHHCPSLAVCALAPEMAAGRSMLRLHFPRFNLFVAKCPPSANATQQNTTRVPP